MLNKQNASIGSGRLNFLNYLEGISKNNSETVSKPLNVENKVNPNQLISPFEDGVLPELNHLQVHQILEVEASVDHALPLLMQACIIFESAGFDAVPFRVAVRNIAAYKNIIDEVKFNPRCARLAKYELQRKGG